MGQIPGIGDGAQSERAKENTDLRVQAYRQLAEGVLRLHTLADPARLTASSVEFVRHLLGCPGVLIVRGDASEEHHRFGGAGADHLQGDQVARCAAKAIESGQPVVDGQGPARGVAVPLLSGARALGALYVAAADLERRLGSLYLDILMLLGKHVGTALDTAIHVHELGAVSPGVREDLIPPGLSLAESKRAFERKIIRTRMREFHGNVAAAARALNVDRGQLSRLLKRLKIDRNEFLEPSALPN